SAQPAPPRFAVGRRGPPRLPQTFEVRAVGEQPCRLGPDRIPRLGQLLLQLRARRLPLPSDLARRSAPSPPPPSCGQDPQPSAPPRPHRRRSALSAAPLHARAGPVLQRESDPWPA